MIAGGHRGAHEKQNLSQKSGMWSIKLIRNKISGKCGSSASILIPPDHQTWAPNVCMPQIGSSPLHDRGAESGKLGKYDRRCFCSLPASDRRAGTVDHFAVCPRERLSLEMAMSMGRSRKSAAETERCIPRSDRQGRTRLAINRTWH